MAYASQLRSLRTSFSSRQFVIGKFIFRLGIAALALSALFALHSWFTTRSLVRTEATVTENVASQNAAGDVLYASHLHFQLADGRIINFVDPVLSDDSGSPTFAAGRVVPVIFPAANPQVAYVATEWRIYSAANWLGILGVVLVDLGLVLRRTGKKTQR